MAIIRCLSEWQQRTADYPLVANCTSVLMAAADYFTVAEAQNSHMRDEHGNLRQIDKRQAASEWQQLHDAFVDSGLSVAILDAAPQLPDLCFTANPSFVVPHKQHIWKSHMAHPSRQPEVELHAKFFRSQGFDIKELSATGIKFEGNGDGLWHPQRFLLHAAVGQRSDLQAWQEIDAAYPELDILLYALQHPDFYHLDTALACLDQDTALIVKDAFTVEALELLNAAFSGLIELSEDEAFQFAGNAFCADGKNVFLEQGCDSLYEKLNARGFCAHPVPTQQFRFSGGSVFCLKQSF
ncbi:MAG: N-dimethylarginine dimethylaminohydrolase [Myxococcota bacterium]|jgi:N-dimethylarginine dimethylaminohydrolase